MFGLPQGFAPLARFYRMPLLVLVGEIADKPVAIDGKVKVRPMLPLTATIDHRYADGWHISQLLKPFRAYLADPAAFEPDPAAVPAPEAPAPTPPTDTEPEPPSEVRDTAAPATR
jgi:pyruvate dehydrogenase E2 component (dihydrolipoamide acetyltransferase)